MLDPTLHLPIVPSSPSLQAQIAALDILSLRLSSFTASTSHAARIPLTSKASLNGSIIHTNDIKVHLGGEWWVDMTASEAADYVQRRKEYLLNEHVRLIEGRHRSSDGHTDVRTGDLAARNFGKSGQEVLPKIGFHPVLYSLPGPDHLSTTEAAIEQPSAQVTATVESAPRETAKALEAKVEEPKAAKDKGKQPARSEESKTSEIRTAPMTSRSLSESSQPPTASLVELLDDEAEEGDETTGAAQGHGDSTTLNEEGLPFHEIRETLDGETIGAPPPPTAGMETSLDHSETLSPKTGEKKKDDYYSAAAVARREALRKKVFNEDTDTESEAEAEGKAEQEDEKKDAEKPPPSEPIKAKGGIIRASSTSAQPQNSQSSQDTSAASKISPASPPPRPRRASSSLPPPNKSILKSSSHKKSVTFDPSIPAPSPPDSPQIGAHSHAQPNKFGFPLPLATIEKTDDEYAPRPVPMIAKPTPTKKNVEEKGFAGFKRGFLAGPPPKVVTIQESQAGSSSSTATAASDATNTAVSAEAIKSVVAEQPPKPSAPSQSTNPAASPSMPAPVPAAAPRKPSLFAQRLAQPEIDASAPEIGMTTTRTPSFPKASESKSTSTVKPSVVEKPLPPSKPVNIVEKNPPASRASSSTSTQASKGNSQEIQKGKNDDDEDEDEEEYDDYSSGDEDEYDLDDALLAREVALEYHRRQAYQPLNRDPDDLDEEAETEGGGGVMLGIPRISDLDPEGHGPLIINPTPDDLRRFVRVGRLENGNLVLAPGEGGLSDSEAEVEGEEGENTAEKGGGDDDKTQDEEERQRLQRKKNRDEVKRKLMGLEVLSSSDRDRQQEKKDKNRIKQEEDWRKSLPPSLGSQPASGSGSVRKEDFPVYQDWRTEPNTLAQASAGVVKEKTPVGSVVAEKNPARSSAPGPARASASATVPAAAASTPSARSAPTPTPPAADTRSQSQSTETAPKPKKISKFKAARMAGQ